MSEDKPAEISEDELCDCGAGDHVSVEMVVTLFGRQYGLHPKADGPGFRAIPFP